MITQFIYAKNKKDFTYALGANTISNDSIVFIEETKEIWNRGVYYAGDLSNYATTGDIQQLNTDLTKLVGDLQINIEQAYALKSDLPTKVSELENDENYLINNCYGKKGVYIIDYDELIYLPDDWTGEKQVQYILVTDGANVNFKLKRYQWYSNGDNPVTVKWESYNNTRQITKSNHRSEDPQQYPSFSNAKKYASNYEGRLLMDSELEFIVGNYSMIDAVLDKVGFPTLITNQSIGLWGESKAIINNVVQTESKDTCLRVVPVYDALKEVSIYTRLDETDTKLQTIEEKIETVVNDLDNISTSYLVVNHTSSENECTLSPNTFHVWDVVESLDLTLGEEEEGIVNEYLFQFTSGETPTMLSLPDTIKWINDFPDIEPNMTYQCSIINNIGVICGV